MDEGPVAPIFYGDRAAVHGVEFWHEADDLCPSASWSAIRGTADALGLVHETRPLSPRRTHPASNAHDVPVIGHRA